MKRHACPKGSQKIPKAISCPYCKTECINCNFHEYESEIMKKWFQTLLTRLFLSVSRCKTVLNTMQGIIACHCWRCWCFPTKQTSDNAAFRAYWVWTTSCLITKLTLIACLPTAILAILLHILQYKSSIGLWEPGAFRSVRTWSSLSFRASTGQADTSWPLYANLSYICLGWKQWMRPSSRSFSSRNKASSSSSCDNFKQLKKDANSERLALELCRQNCLLASRSSTIGICWFRDGFWTWHKWEKHLYRW